MFPGALENPSLPVVTATGSFFSLAAPYVRLKLRSTVDSTQQSG
jgi:hypothetical protein